MEFAGAFGDLDTMIPFVVGYVTLNQLDPLGVLVAFGFFKIFVGLVSHARKPQAFKPGDEWHPFEAKPGGTWRSGAKSDMIWLWPDIRLGPIRNTACSTTWCGYRNIVGAYCEAKWSSA
jgi:hypothetical protein